MNWISKYNQVLKGVLGDEYFIVVMPDQFSCEIWKKDERVLKRSTAYNIAYHWQQDVKDIINIIVNLHITEEFQKLKNDN